MTQPKTASKFALGPLPGPYSVKVRGAFKVHLILDANGRAVAELDNSYKPLIITKTAALLRAAPEMYELLLLGQRAIMEGSHNLSTLMNVWLDEGRRIKAAIDGEG
ncbi:hypothetical protein LCGC14_1612970 [marine sediment metagenome]|uniref:Uncharacterized protein n=1 Tax=marine sediment metagenome TaxID=412755 RepID=A0A0F9IUI6_9ZZZZ